MVIISNKSNSGSTIQNNLIFETENSVKSLASLLLLNEYYKYLDEDYLDSISETQNYLNKRFAYLENILLEQGDLSCAYCGKSNLDIGHISIRDSHLDSKNDNLATIDHIVPRSANLIDPLDESNWCVSCKNCNTKKGSKPVEEFKNMK